MARWAIIASIAGFLLFSSAYALQTSGLAGVKNAVSDMCATLKDMLPVVSMLMIIGGAVVYASGQIMGAETRARATTWATAMVVGAMFGILIAVIAPSVLTAIYGCQIKCGGGVVLSGGTSC